LPPGSERTRLALSGSAGPAAVDAADKLLGKIDALPKSGFAGGRTFSQQDRQAAAKKHSRDKRDHFLATFIHEGDSSMFAFYSPRQKVDQRRNGFDSRSWPIVVVEP
jgi:hypothetical protein